MPPDAGAGGSGGRGHRGPARRLVPGGLRWRLSVCVAGVIVAALAVVFVAVYDGTGTQVRRQIDAELRDDGREFARALAAVPRPSAQRLRSVASRYVAGAPFSASSTLLFAQLPGGRAVANRPELLRPSAPDDNESPAEQAIENRLSARLLSSGDGYATLPAPDVGDLRVLKISERIRGGRVTVGVGEPLAPVARAQRGVAQAFILAGLVTLAGALVAAFAIGTRFSRPLRRMAAIATRVDSGDLSPRIHERPSDTDEMRVLAEAFNHMLDRLTDAFAGQRAFVADASHELRTPLTAIRGQLEVLASDPQPSGAEVERVTRIVAGEISRTTRLVDDLLLLASAEQTQFLRLEEIDLAPFVGELWDGMTLVAERRFELGEVPAGTLRADPDRLAQALRNLIANAIEHTRPRSGAIAMAVEALPGGHVRFTIDDDGPGISADQRERVFHRFHRTDVARDRATGGTGLGLAIVLAIAQAHDGRVSAGESPLGGARLTLELPGLAPVAAAPDPLRPPVSVP